MRFSPRPSTLLRCPTEYIPVDTEKLSFWVRIVLAVLSMVLTQTGQISLARTLYQRFEEHI